MAFVSHSAQLVTELCDTAILMEAGRIAACGEPREIINRYYQSMSLSGAIPAAADPSDLQQPVAASDPAFFDPELVSKPVTYETCGARISQVQLLNESGKQVNQLAHGYQYSLNYRVDMDEDAGSVEPACLIKTAAGVELAGMVAEAGDASGWITAGSTLRVHLPFTCLFTPGTYFCNVGVRGTIDTQFDYLHRILDVLMFKVGPDASQTYTGLVDVRTPQAASFSVLPAVLPVDTPDT